MPKTLGDVRHGALVKFLVDKRIAAGMKQSDLAKCLHEHQSFVARLESGQRRIDVIELIKLAEILGFDASLAVRELMALQVDK